MSFSKVRSVMFFIALGAISVLFLYIIKPLFYPIFWAAVIASIAYPLYEWLKNKIKYANLSAAIILIITILVVIVPIVFVSGLLVKEALDLYGELSNNGGKINSTIQAVLNWIKHNPLTGKLNFDESFWIEKISQTTTSATGILLSGIRSFTENSLTFLVM